MKIQVTQVSDKMYWYAHYVGKLFTVKYLDSISGEYIVRDNEGYLNVIKQQDCKPVKED